MGKWQIHDPTFDADSVHPMHAVYPWCGHRWFAYDLVRFLKPRRIAELGVHWGTSFFAFCQAVRDEGFDAEIIGVDTWAGDDHTGPYGEEVIDTVRRTISEHFDGLDIDLLRMTFDEALEHVADDSVDVMHIDGFHTYEAVQHDYETWLPKLAPNGMVMFHDVAESTGYGSARFWADVTKQHPGFMFEHSWGLGVLFPKGDAVLRRLRARNLTEKIRLYEYKGELDLVRRQNDDLGAMAKERYEVLQRQKDVIEEAQQMARERYDTMKRQGEALDMAKKVAEERYETMRQLGVRIDELKGATRERDERIQNLNRSLGEVKAERDRQHRSLTHTVDRLERRLESVETSERRFSEQAERRREKIESLIVELTERRADAHAANRLAAKRESELHIAEKRLEAASQMAENRLERLRELNAEAQTRVRRLGELESKLAEAHDTIARRDSQIEDLTQEVAERDRLIAERDAMIEELRRRLDDLELDVELLQTRAGHVEDVLASHRREIGALMKTEPGKRAAEQLDSESVGRERIES